MKPTKKFNERGRQGRWRRRCWHRRTFRIAHSDGLHTRPAAQFVRLAQTFPAQIQVKKGKAKVDGKSILNILALGARKGNRLTLLAKGTKAQEAIKTLGRFLQSGHYE